jgi:hypothetical protein
MQFKTFWMSFLEEEEKRDLLDPEGMFYPGMYLLKFANQPNIASVNKTTYPSKPSSTELWERKNNPHPNKIM